MASAVRNQTGSDSLKDRLQSALAKARQVCGLDDASVDCKLAWETVAELEISAENQEQPFFSAYCEEHPGAAECKVYDT